METKKHPRTANHGGRNGLIYTPNSSSMQEILHESAAPFKSTASGRKMSEYDLLTTMGYELTWEEASEVANHVDKNDFVDPTTGTLYEEIIHVAQDFVAHGHGRETVALSEIYQSMLNRGAMENDKVKREYFNVFYGRNHVNGRYRLPSIISAVVTGSLRYQLSLTCRWEDCSGAPLDVLVSRFQAAREKLNATYQRLNPGAREVF